MHTIKITLNPLLFEYQCTSGKFIRLPNRIESKLFLPNWNALAAGGVPNPAAKTLVNGRATDAGDARAVRLARGVAAVT